jgi:hypothetical protein
MAEMHEAVPHAEGPVWAEAVCVVGAVCAAAAVECAAAVVAADIANSQDGSPKTQLELAYVHQNGDRNDLV